MSTDAARDWAQFEADADRAMRVRGWPAPLRQRLLVWLRVRCDCDVRQLNEKAPRREVAEVWQALLDGRDPPAP